MADSSVVLREYLVSLGFKVDQKEGKKFDDGLNKWDKKAALLGKTLGATGVAAAAMVTSFAYSMEKLYYASRRTDSAVGNIKALDYASRQVGVKNIQQSLEAVARNLRSNPGLTGLLESLGVQVKGRDKSDVLIDLVSQLKKMPFFVAEKYANLFGIDPDTLFMLQDGLDKMKAANIERKQWAAELGLDEAKAAEASVQLVNSWRSITEHGSMFVDSVLIRGLPVLQAMATESNKILDSWTKILTGKTGSGNFGKDLWDGLFAEKVGRVELTEDAKKRLGMDADAGKRETWGGVELSPDAKQRLGQAPLSTSTNKSWLRQKYEGAMKALGAKGFQPAPGDERSIDAATDDTRKATPPAAPQAAQAAKPPSAEQQKLQAEAAPLFAKLEKKYDLPAGWMDRVWKQESGRGTNMLSSAGAQGHFQFMPETAKQYGLKNPNDLGESAEASAKMYSYLLKKYDGDQQKAAAAYNWGEGRVDKFGLGRAPAETRGYVDAIANKSGSGQAGTQAPSINQTNHITVTGSSDPVKAAKAVGEEINSANADVVRNFKTRVQ